MVWVALRRSLVGRDNGRVTEQAHYIRVLGPLDVLVDGQPAPVIGRRKKSLLAALSLRAASLVSNDHLVEAVWPEGAPAKALGALRVHVSHLRRMLRLDETAVDPITTGDNGYGLMLGSVDAVEFERCYQGALGYRLDMPERARTVLAEGLDLWRADLPLPELSDVGWARPEIKRLIELRREATDELIDLRLRCGEHASLVPELEARVGHDPYGERGWAQLMLALYRAGQQSRALEAYTRARRTLIDELGIEPAPALSHLEHQILTHDPDLVLDTRPVLQPRDEAVRQSEPALRKFGELGAGARAVVEAAAVLGDRVPLSMLSAVSGIGSPGFLAALEECERAEFIAASGGEGQVHPTFANGVLDHLGRMAKAEMHARAASELGSHPLADPDRQADALARHSVGAIGIMPATGVIDACLSAANRAEERAAFEVAAAHYRNARLAAQHLDDVDARRRGLLAAIRESECLIRTGAVAVAVPIISYVIEEARRGPDPDLFAEAVLVASRQESMISDHPGAALQREALELLPDRPSPARVRLLALVAISLVMTDRAAEREEVAGRAVAMARLFPEDPVLLAEALAARYQATFHAENLSDRITWAMEASEAALRANDHVRAAHALLYSMAAHIEEGDRVKTEIALRAASLHAELATDARYLWASTSWQALLAFADGNYTEGEQLGLSALSAWGHTANVDAVACHLTQQTMVALMRGDTQTVTELLTDAVSQRPDLLGARFMLAFALSTNQPADADRLIDDVGPHPLAAIGQDQTQLLCWAMLAEATGRLGRRPWTEDLVAAIAPHADQHVVVNLLGGGGIYWGCLGHHLGTAQVVLGHRSDARMNFRAARVAHERFGAAWWAARSGRALTLLEPAGP